MYLCRLKLSLKCCIGNVHIHIATYYRHWFFLSFRLSALMSNGYWKSIGITSFLHNSPFPMNFKCAFAHIHIHMYTWHAYLLILYTWSLAQLIFYGIWTLKIIVVVGGKIWALLRQTQSFLKLMRGNIENIRKMCRYLILGCGSQFLKRMISLRRVSHIAAHFFSSIVSCMFD